jgi:DNA-binding NtrC family response regulator
MASFAAAQELGTNWTNHVWLVSPESPLGDVVAELSHHGAPPTIAADVVDALTALRAGKHDTFMAWLPIQDWPAEEIVEEALRLRPETAVIVHDPTLSDESVVRLVRIGAFDVWRSGMTSAQIAEKLSAIAEYRREHAVREAEEENEPWRRLLVGRSPAMQQVCGIIRLVGNRRSTILITGETGTGKEMAARALHLAGERRHQPFVAVNCSALPENLLEAELFGHVKGAFTGAVQTRVGRFEQASRGTIFLDEIADMPLDLQAKLLRVLQEREFQRLGSSETVKVDVRVIAACNVDLVERVRQGRFREDLYYRVNVVPIEMPPLRDRPGDVAILARHFVEKICRQEQIPLRQIAGETLQRLARHHWPGNVRQLENAVEMAIALSGDRQVLYPSDFPLPSALDTRTVASARAPVPRIVLPESGLDFDSTVGQIELGILEQALERTRGNKKLAAELLGLKRTTLTAKLKSLEMQARLWGG